MSGEKHTTLTISETKLEATMGVIGDMVASDRLKPSDVAAVAIDMVKRHASSERLTRPDVVAAVVETVRHETSNPRRKPSSRGKDRHSLGDRLARSFPEFSREEIDETIREARQEATERRRAIPSEPCMPPEEAIHDEYLVCLIDGVMRCRLYRYLLTHYEMTPEEYRAHFKLRSDYPMVSANLLRQPNFKY